MRLLRSSASVLVLMLLAGVIVSWVIWLIVRPANDELERLHGLELRRILRGTTAGDEFGSSVAVIAAAEGVTAEILVGAPHESSFAEKAGRACVFMGRLGSVRLDLHGGGEGWLFGSGVAALDDVDGDGVVDLAVGGKGNGWTGHGPGGGVRVVSGLSGKTLHVLAGRHAKDNYGHAVAAAGDVDGDGVSDILVGAPGTFRKERAGYAEIRSGRDGRLLRTLTGPGRGDRFGFSVCAAGDVDGDGRADVVVASLADGDHAGCVRAFSGETGEELFRVEGDRPGDELGHDLALVADHDGDGRRDILAGAFRQEGRGYARVLSSRDGSTLRQLDGFADDDGFGHSVGYAGDVDGDGTGDLCVGAPNATIEAVDLVGYATVFSGRDGHVLMTYPGDRERSHLGYDVAGGGDVNGDGFDDVVLGTTIYDGRPGEARIVSACAVESTVAPSPGGAVLKWLPKRRVFRVTHAPTDRPIALSVVGETALPLETDGAGAAEITFAALRRSVGRPYAARRHVDARRAAVILEVVTTGDPAGSRAISNRLSAVVCR